MAQLIFVIYLAFMNISAFVLYGIDKNKARNKKWRIPEKTLLTIGLFGGGIGALAAMKVFRHKTRKRLFYIVNFLGIFTMPFLFVYFTNKK